MSNQIQIINYFKFVDQSNSKSINSFKSSSFINCFCSTSRICFSINQIARTSHNANNAISNLKIHRRLKTIKQEYMIDVDVDHINRDIHVERFSTIAKELNAIKASIKSIDSSKIKWLKSNFLINNFCSTFRFYFSINRAAKTSQYQHIAIDQTSSLKNQSKIKMQSFCQFKQEYIVDVDVTHININIRVKTTLTKTKEYKLNKSIESMIKSFKSVKLFKKLKFSSSINCFNSTFRFCHSINQIVKTSHNAFDKIMSFASIKSIKLIKSFKFAVFINSSYSTFRFSLSINHDLIMS